MILLMWFCGFEIYHHSSHQHLFCHDHHGRHLVFSTSSESPPWAPLALPCHFGHPHQYFHHCRPPLLILAIVSLFLCHIWCNMGRKSKTDMKELNMYCGGRANETVLSSRNWYSYHFHLTFIQITFTFMKERRVNVGRANRATIIQSWGRLGVHPSNNIEPRVEI